MYKIGTIDKDEVIKLLSSNSCPRVEVRDGQSVDDDYEYPGLTHVMAGARKSGAVKVQYVNAQSTTKGITTVLIFDSEERKASYLKLVPQAKIKEQERLDQHLNKDARISKQKRLTVGELIGLLSDIDSELEITIDNGSQHTNVISDIVVVDGLPGCFPRSVSIEINKQEQE